MTKAAQLNLAEGCKGGRRSRRPSGQSPRRAEQTCEPRYSPTRPQGGAAPKQKDQKTTNKISILRPLFRLGSLLFFSF